ncbi:phage tail protein [Spartinivicinus poritis]|uniref:Phage tail protein n=1 Tax=Spartinivicinus poritis TaxID=2994640 RepID=A0ABT5UF99_9GAMM|nr:phage tail protein [Spartinivicinus sp. A2-2]MDE1465023.1 phage tail protein [Spartinivicinus sp. A2-2]
MPFVNYRFKAFIETGSLQHAFDVRFKSISGLKISRQLGMTDNCIHLTSSSSPSTLTLQRGVILGSSLRDVHLLETTFWDNRLLQSQIIITLINNSDLPLTGWKIKDAYFSGWEWGTLDGSSSDVAFETMTYTYNSIQPL